MHTKLTFRPSHIHPQSSPSKFSCSSLYFHMLHSSRRIKNIYIADGSTRPPPLGSNCESHTYTGMYCACIDISMHELTHISTLQKYTYSRRFWTASTTICLRWPSIWSATSTKCQLRLSDWQLKQLIQRKH